VGESVFIVWPGADRLAQPLAGLRMAIGQMFEIENMTTIQN
jgi:hypothetical protein